MDILKNTYLVNAIYVLVAILVVLIGVYREHIYREKNDKQQHELTTKQIKINEQQQEIIRLIYKLNDLQAKNSHTLSSDIAQVRLAIEEMRRQAIISDSTANEMIEMIAVRADGTYRADGSVTASGSKIVKHPRNFEKQNTEK